MKTEHELRRAVSEYSVATQERGWVANHDGNVSARLARGGFLITPTAVSKRVCAPDTIVHCGDDGKPLSKGRPPSEVALHVGAYQARPEVMAVIHAHPPYASAFALAQRPLAPVAMPEVIVSLGDQIPLSPLVLPKDPQAVDVVAKMVMQADVVLLAGNGILAVGDDLEQAYLRVELAEHYARVLTIAHSLGGPAELSSEARGRMLELRAKAGLGPKPATSEEASAPAKGPGSLAQSIRPIVAEEIQRVLSGGKR